jgi:uncharacterized membrane protein (UPF0127 family)
LASFLSPLVRHPDRPLILRNTRTGTAVVTRLEAAFDSKSRNRGLLGRTGLAPDHALVIAPCSSVHTFFMKFPIDVMFVARDGTVRRIASGVRHWRLALSLRSFAVIETAAGVIGTSGTQPGDRLAIDERP